MWNQRHSHQKTTAIDLVFKISNHSQSVLMALRRLSPRFRHFHGIAPPNLPISQQLFTVLGFLRPTASYLLLLSEIIIFNDHTLQLLCLPLPRLQSFSCRNPIQLQIRRRTSLDMHPPSRRVQASYRRIPAYRMFLAQISMIAAIETTRQDNGMRGSKS